MSPRRLSLLGLVAGILLAPSAALAAPDELLLVSRGGDGRPASTSTGPANSQPVGVGAGGRLVAFASTASDLVPGVTGDHLYVRDVEAGTTVAVDRADGADGALAERTRAGAISADGRYVVFSGGLGGQPERTYRRDLAAGRTELVSRADGPGGEPVDGIGGVVSADGRFVSFAARRTGVTDDPPSASEQLYVRDMVAGRTVLVSRASGADGAPAGEYVGGPSGISPGGRYVVFRSTGAALGPEEHPGRTVVYMRDLRTHRTLVVSRADGADGRLADDAPAGPTPVVTGGCRVAFTAAGRLAPGAPADGAPQSYVRDVCAGTTTLVSRQDGPGGAAADVPAATTGATVATGGMDATGTRVLFSAPATNLHPGTGRARPTVYVRNLATDTTTLVSRAAGPDGAPDTGGADSIAPNALTGDGRFAIFRSSDETLLPELADTAGAAGLQVFRRELAPGPTADPGVACGVLDDPGLGGPPVRPCEAGEPPSAPGNPGTRPPLVLPDAGAPADAGGAAGADAAPAGTAAAPAAAPTFVYRPRLLRVRVAARRVTGFLTVPATVTVVVERRRGRGWRRVGAPRSTVARAGTVRVALPRLRRGRYRLTLRATAQAGAASPRIRRALSIRHRRAAR